MSGPFICVKCGVEVNRYAPACPKCGASFRDAPDPRDARLAALQSDYDALDKSRDAMFDELTAKLAASEALVRELAGALGQRCHVGSFEEQDAAQALLAKVPKEGRHG